jgi:hypothetical protein
MPGIFRGCEVNPPLTASAPSLALNRACEERRNLLTQAQNAVGEAVVSPYDYDKLAVGRSTSVKHGGAAFAPVGAAFNRTGIGKSVSEQLQCLSAAKGENRSLRKLVTGLEQELEKERRGAKKTQG